MDVSLIMNQHKNPNQFRPTVAYINLEALRHNFLLARELAGPKVSILGVVKTNAYGHGAVHVSKVLEREGVHALGVASPEEGIELREAGIKTPILLFGGPFHAPGDLLAEYQLTPVLFNEVQLKSLASSLSSNLSIHLKIDTGMTRLGILPAEVSSFLQSLKKYPRIELTGALTHLAQSDETFERETAQQYQSFQSAEEEIKKLDAQIKFYHLANSAALLGKNLGPCNMVRPGLMLYGVSPNPRFEEGKKLKPVMHFETEVISLKEVSAGVKVSYGGTWTTSRRSKIAVLPVGYADGYIRHLSNVGEVLLLGQRVPVVGRVCMDLTMIDVTDLPQVSLGNKVTLWGDTLPVEEMAGKAGTISYELLCAVSKRIPRIYEGDHS